MFRSLADMDSKVLPTGTEHVRSAIRDALNVEVGEILTKSCRSTMMMRRSMHAIVILDHCLS